MEQEATHEEFLGVVFGFPMCCIENFTKSEDPLDGFDEKNIFYGTGYVPCKECRKKSALELIKGIDSNRLMATKFPQDRVDGEGMSRLALMKRIQEDNHGKGND